MIKKTTGSFRSNDNEHDIFYTVWEGEELPRAIMQISHGMCEHHGRYEGFAEYLCSRGIVVCALDHLGHGRSVADRSELGYFGAKESRHHLAADQDALRALMRKKYRRLPYVLFGHSMGSFVARDYITRYAENIDGAVICGTAGTNKMVGMGIKLADLICALRGRKHRSSMLRNTAFKGYNSRFPGEGDSAWLSRDADVRAAYEADELCGYCFTAGGYAEMFRLLKSVSGPEWAARVPRSLPIYIIAGAEDPVGDYGNGVREVWGLLDDHEQCDLALKIYDGMRHEIHNELGREEVMEDIHAFVLRVADGAVECNTL